jgi:hypothetical protein
MRGVSYRLHQVGSVYERGSMQTTPDRFRVSEGFHTDYTRWFPFMRGVPCRLLQIGSVYQRDFMRTTPDRYLVTEKFQYLRDFFFGNYSTPGLGPVH